MKKFVPLLFFSVIFLVSCAGSQDFEGELQIQEVDELSSDDQSDIQYEMIESSGGGFYVDGWEMTITPPDAWQFYSSPFGDHTYTLSQEFAENITFDNSIFIYRFVNNELNRAFYEGGAIGDFIATFNSSEGEWTEYEYEISEEKSSHIFVLSKLNFFYEIHVPPQLYEANPDVFNWVSF